MNPNAKREHFEWVNMWHDHTNLTPEREAAAKRLLFIGDSITNGMRPYLPVALRDKLAVKEAEDVNVDFLTTSKGIDNPDLIRELEYMTSGYTYDFIQFNNCLHGFSVEESDYAVYYEEVVKFLLHRVTADKMVIMTGTPHSVKDNPEEYSELNNRVCRRNCIVKEIAEKYGIAVNDLYSAIYGKAEYRSNDGYHYNSDGYEFLADVTSDFAIKLIK